jgi:hypothetical protein
MLDSTTIKKFILHPDVHLSSSAMEYFNFIFSEDTEILNLALDRYPSPSEKEKVHLFSETENLKLNLEALNKILLYLPDAPQELRFKFERLLANTDVSIIKKVGLEKLKLMPSIKEMIHNKLKFSTLPTEALLKELSAFSIKNEDKYMGEFNHSYGYLIVNELADREDLNEKLIIETLTETEPEEFSYYECYLLTLAGKRKLTTLIPVLINGLACDDLISEESMFALVRIGTKDIIDLIAERYPNENDGFKIYASGVLENIKIEQSEITALKLLKEETDISMKTMLAGALCQLYSVNALPEIIELIEKGYDSSMLNLEEYAYINCVFNGLNIPEMELWKEGYEEEKSFYLSASKTSVSSEPKIGRNDPCPCGSGKKYKKCCGNN